MAESLENESEQQLSDDEESQNVPVTEKDPMEIEGDDTETTEEEQVNKENNKNQSNSKKRKNISPDTTDTPAKKKQKTDHNNIQKLKIKIGSDEVGFDVKILKKIPFLKPKIIKDNKNNNLLKFKSSRDGRFTAEKKFTLQSFEHMITFINNDNLDHINEIKELEKLILCADKFQVKLPSDEIEEVYNDINDNENTNDKTYKKWKNSASKTLKILYKAITQNTNDNENDNENEIEIEIIENENKNENENDASNKKAKPKSYGARKSSKKDKDTDGDSKMDDIDIEQQKKRKETKQNKKQRKKRSIGNVVKTLKDTIPEYLRLSEDEIDSDNNNNNMNNKVKRLHKQKEKAFIQSLMTQQIMSASDDNENENENESDEEDEMKREKKLNAAEKYIEILDQIKLEQIATLQTMTIHRLCRRHGIEHKKPLSEKEKAKKNKLEKERKRFTEYKYYEKKKLVRKLRDLKKKMCFENGIHTLADVKSVDVIGGLARKTILRLCKAHKIKANDKLIVLIEKLEERYENPLDDDDYIETLKDVDIDAIKDYDREVLVRLCNAHSIGTTKKKKKKRKKKKKKGSDSDEESDTASDSADSNTDAEDDELIQKLEAIKQGMNEKEKKRQQNKIDKLTQIQEDIVNVGFRENYLTISGSDTFKQDCLALLAVCNSVVTAKGNNYSVCDDELRPYKVCISEHGARTIKVMMTIARGGSVVNKSWLNYSIKGKKWLNPQHYEAEWKNWQLAAHKSRESRIIKRKKKEDDMMIDENENDNDRDELDEINGPLLYDYSIYIQDRPNIKPSATVLKHLAWAAGAQIVDKHWQMQRLKKKDIDDGLGMKSDDENENENEEKQNKSGKKKKGKKSASAKKKKGKKQAKKDINSDEEYDNEEEEKEEEENSKEEADDENNEDSDIEQIRNKNKKRKKKKETRIKASRTRDKNKNANKPKKKTKLRRYKLIISHPGICKKLKLKKNNKIAIVGQSWLFECIEHYRIKPCDEYTVKPSKNQSRSPVH